MPLRVAFASDHAGIKLRRTLIAFVQKLGYDTIDLGTHTAECVDYPDYARKLCEVVDGGKKKSHPKKGIVERGVLVCGSGIGMSIAANRYPHIRCALVCDVLQTELSRQHNNSNVIALGERATDASVAKACVSVFLKTSFLGGRHRRRTEKCAIMGE